MAVDGTLLAVQEGTIQPGRNAVEQVGPDRYERVDLEHLDQHGVIMLPPPTPVNPTRNPTTSPMRISSTLTKFIYPCKFSEVSPMTLVSFWEPSPFRDSLRTPRGQFPIRSNKRWLLVGAAGAEVTGSRDSRSNARSPLGKTVSSVGTTKTSSPLISDSSR